MIQRWIYEEEGQTLVEYGFLISFIALIVIAAVTLVGRRTLTFYTNASNQIP